MLVSGSVSSSFRRFTSPKDVLPVPGGPIIRKMSRACLARVTRVLNLPYSPFIVNEASTLGSRWARIRSRLDLVPERKPCIALNNAPVMDSSISCSIAHSVPSGLLNTLLSVCEFLSLSSIASTFISTMLALITMSAQALGTSS